MSHIIKFSKSKVGVLVGLALVLAAVFSFQHFVVADAGTGNNNFLVKVYNGDPINDNRVSGATITLIGGADNGLSGVTDSTGSFTFHVHDGQFTARITHPDFYTQDFSMIIDMPNNELDAPMIPKSGGGTGTCTDGIQNGDETGIDTGGRCGTPPPGGTGTCTDGIQNGDETGIDTGGRCGTPPPSNGCTPTPPSGRPLLNIWPIANNGANCTDYPLLAVKNVSRNTDYANGGSVNASVGETLRVRLYVHNGTVDLPANIARNVMLKANVPSTTGSATISVQAWANNADQITSGQKGGNFTVNMGSNESLSYVQGSALLFDRGPSNQRGFSDDVVSGGASVGDMNGCFPYLHFVTFELRVNAAAVVNNPPSGSLDQADCTTIAGWATDSDTPNSSVSVEIYKDGPFSVGTLVTTTLANLYRSDVGQHAYHIDTPSAFKDGNSHTVYVYALDTTSGARTLLSGSPKTIYCPVCVLGTIQVNSNLNYATYSVSGASTFNGTGTQTFSNKQIGNYTIYVPDISGYTKSVTPTSGTLVCNATLTFNLVFTSIGTPTLSIAKTVRNVTAGQTGFQESVTANPGDQVEFRMTVTNTGTATANNVIINDALPQYFSGNPTSFNIGDLTSGQSRTVNLTATIGSASNFPVGDSTHTNTATASGSNVASVSDGAQVVVHRDTINNPPTGYLDQADCNVIAGWATDSDTPNSSVTVEIYKDGPVGSGTLVATTLANLYRSDVGQHAYHIDTPSAFKDGGSHSVYAYALDTTTNAKTLLTGSPKTILCPIGTPTLSIAKTVRNVTAGQTGFQESVTANPGDQVEFRMTVTNTGTATANNVIINDALPQYFSGNPTSFNIGDLTSGQSRTVNLTATIGSASNFPVGDSTHTNTATASGSNVASVSDGAQVVVQKIIVCTTGTIQVNSNLNYATYSVSGPSNFNGTGTQTFSNAQIGNYTIYVPDISGYTKSVSPTNGTLVCDQTLTFNITFTPVGQPGLSIAKTVRNVTAGQTGFQESVTANPGDQVEFRMTVTNTGTATANNVIINDALPQYFSGNPTSFNIGDLTSGQSRTVNLTATIGSASNFPVGDSTHTNTATASGSNVASVSDGAQVVVQKIIVCTTGTIQVNSNLNYATYSVSGPSNFNGTGTQTFSNAQIGNYTIYVPDISGYTKSVSPTNGTLVCDQTLTFNITFTPVGQPGLSIAKTVRNVTAGQTGFQESVTANPGDQVEFRMTVTNTGSASINNVNVVDTLPNNFTANGNANFSLGLISAGESKTVNLLATAASETNFPLGNSTWTNSATVSGPAVTSATDTAQVVVYRSNPGNPTVSITKTVRNVSAGQSSFVNSISANPGDQVEFRMTVTIGGQGIANNVVVTDTLPNNFYSNGTTTFNLGSINTGSSQTVNLLATAASESSFPIGSSTWTNTANVTSTNAGNNSASATVLINRGGGGQSSLSIYKTVRNVTSGQSSFTKSVTANPGDQVEFRMQVTNTGNTTANNVVITDTLPSNFYASSNTTFNVGSLSAGQSNAVTLMTTIAGESNFPVGNSSWINTAFASATGISQVSDTAVVLVNRQGGCTINCNNNSVISINKQVRNITQGQTGYQDYVNAQVNDRVSFRITVSNTGNTTAQNVRLTDTLPSGLSYVAGTLYSDYYFGNNNLFNSQQPLGDFSVNQSRTVTLEATVNSGTGQLVNSATATANNTSSVSDTAYVNVSQVAGGNVDLVLSKRAYNSTKGADAPTVTADVNDIIVYTLTVENRGNTTATNYVFEDDLTDVQQLAMLSDFGGGDFNMSNLYLRWPSVSIPANSKVEKTFSVTVRNPIPTNYDYVITNTYGNTINIQVRRPQVQGAYVAPKTGPAMTLSIIFGLLAMAGFALYRTGKLKEFVATVKAFIL